MENSAWCCKRISWESHRNTNWLLLTLNDGSCSGVGAMFDTLAVYKLIDDCSHTGVKGPEDLVGKLFQTKWAGDEDGSVPGSSLKAIRIHPAYGKTQRWLRVGILLMSENIRKHVQDLLEED